MAPWKTVVSPACPYIRDRWYDYSLFEAHFRRRHYCEGCFCGDDTQTGSVGRHWMEGGHSLRSNGGIVLRFCFYFCDGRPRVPGQPILEPLPWGIGRGARACCCLLEEFCEFLLSARELWRSHWLPLHILVPVHSHLWLPEVSERSTAVIYRT